MSEQTGLSRRKFLGSVGGAAAVVSASLVAGCGGGDDGTPSDGGTSTSPAGSTGATAPSGASASGSGSASAVTSASGPASSGGSSVLPTFAAQVPAKPDLPGDENGTPDAFLAYPANPVKVYDQPPLSGGTISSLKVSAAIPPPMDKNPFWQELNKRVGATLKLENSPLSQYRPKLATTIAGGDLPDTLQLRSNFIPHLGDVLTKTCQDLTPFLAGDAAKDYPYLAALPTIAWKNVVFDNKIYGVPYPLGIVNADIKIRQDIADKLGVETTFADGKEFMAMCQALSDVKSNRFAIDTVGFAQKIAAVMVGSPNVYRVQDGKFTRDIQTDEFKQSIDIAKQLWDAKCIYPDSIAGGSFHDWFTSGKGLIIRDGYTNWSGLTTEGLKGDPKFQIGGLVPAKWEGGGQAAHPTGNGMYTFTAMKKAKAGKIKDLLKMLDWFATPFGTDGYLFRRHGIPGRDYTLKGTDPVETPTGVNECQHMTLSYLATAPQPLYMPGNPELAKTQHAYLAKLMTVTEPLPTVGLVSATDLEKGASLTKPLNSAVIDIVLGRKKLSDWDGVVKTYLSGGGEKINQEYAEAYAKVNG